MLRVKELREALDPPLSQERLAARAGISTQTVRRAERSGRIGGETLRRLSVALGVPIGDLFEEESA